MGFMCWDPHDPKLWGRTLLIAVPIWKVNSPTIEFQLDDEPAFPKTGKGIIPESNTVFFDLSHMEDGWQQLLPRILKAQRLRLKASTGAQGIHRYLLLEFRYSPIDLEKFREVCKLPGLLSKDGAK
jgi:hypothetical protein